MLEDMRSNGMRLRAGFATALLLAAGAGLAGQSDGAAENAASGAEKTGPVWFIPIKGDIMPSMTAFVRRETKRAREGGASFLVF